MADAGWHVTIVNSPCADRPMTFPAHANIDVRNSHRRPSYIVKKQDYVRYVAAVLRAAISIRPDVVYASDPLGALPGILTTNISRARLIYHEHDTPDRGALPRPVMWWRRRAAQKAEVVVFPNAHRADYALKELSFSADRLKIVWNVPRRAEIPQLIAEYRQPLIIYYHGSITPDRLPMAMVHALHRLDGRVRLEIAGYEAPGAKGYLAQLLNSAYHNGIALAAYRGVWPTREQLLNQAAQHAHVGLAFMPRNCNDINMRYMAGASNKPFDFMAAGMALLVSDLPEWNAMFVQPGFARSCDPADARSIATQLQWFIDNPDEMAQIRARNRTQIEREWNYDTAFAPVIAEVAVQYLRQESAVRRRAQNPALSP